MRFNFDELVNRRGSNCAKWDEAKDAEVLPMWVADMDFKVAPAISQALMRRVQHGIFGYVEVPDAYYQAVIHWFSSRHGWTMQRDWIIYTIGVVPALSAVIKAVTKPGDKILVQTPVYNLFFSSIRNNGCEVVCNDLLLKDGSYTVNFDDLEQKAADPDVKALLLCNPHHPAGRVWTRDELTRIGDICLRNHVFVIADEIHCELTFNGNHYTPFAALSDTFLQNSATCTSPSKAFNIAGLQIANITIADADIRQRVDKAININEVCDVNPFGVDALMAAYNECGDWLDQLTDYLWDNYLYLIDFFARELPQLSVTRLEGTYLVWVDCRSLGESSVVLAQRLRKAHKVWLNAGSLYGAAGEGFLRINIACPRSLLKTGLERIAEGLK